MNIIQNYYVQNLESLYVQNLEILFIEYRNNMYRIQRSMYRIQRSMHRIQKSMYRIQNYYVYKFYKATVRNLISNRFNQSLAYSDYILHSMIKHLKRECVMLSNMNFLLQNKTILQQNKISFNIKLHFTIIKLNVMTIYDIKIKFYYGKIIKNEMNVHQLNFDHLATQFDCLSGCSTIFLLVINQQQIYLIDKKLKFKNIYLYLLIFFRTY